tara:strand:- start:180 stop:650 length:471 start_codon:yes stop_codon:yes gene_type:complete
VILYNIFKNVLTPDQRKKLIKECKPYLREWGEGTPGRQSRPLSFNHPQFQWAHKIFHERVSKELQMPLQWDCSFFNETNGNKKSMLWHNHPVDYAGVYYMKIFPLFSNGTLFEEGLVKAPQNSLLLFPGKVLHTCPTSPLRFKRYTMSLNWNRLKG